MITNKEKELLFSMFDDYISKLWDMTCNDMFWPNEWTIEERSSLTKEIYDADTDEDKGEWVEGSTYAYAPEVARILVNKLKLTLEESQQENEDLTSLNQLISMAEALDLKCRDRLFVVRDEFLAKAEEHRTAYLDSCRKSDLILYREYRKLSDNILGELHDTSTSE